MPQDISGYDVGALLYCPANAHHTVAQAVAAERLPRPFSLALCLEDTVRAYNPTASFDKIRAAYEFAAAAHQGQLRKDGSPFVTHPLAVAQIVAEELHLDSESIEAALLHDTIEDTAATHEDIAKQFSPTVADLVEGVSKLTRVHYTSKAQEQMENLRKMLLAMSKDIRVILIKVSDRLHNMRTMEYQTPEKQKQKSFETLEIYAPIAHRLGMQKMKWELEDLSLKYLDPISYREIVDALDGVDVNSDYEFTTVGMEVPNENGDGVHMAGYTFTKGINHLNGEQALCFARERHAFDDGDNQRGKNQMAVIRAIVDKASSPAILKGYQKVLDAVSTSFITSLTYEDISSLVQMQLRDNVHWNITSYSVTGYGGTEECYSMPGQALWVMWPDYDTVNVAKDLIAQVMAGQTPVIPED